MSYHSASYNNTEDELTPESFGQVRRKLAVIRLDRWCILYRESDLTFAVEYFHDKHCYRTDSIAKVLCPTVFRCSSGYTYELYGKMVLKSYKYSEAVAANGYLPIYFNGPSLVYFNLTRLEDGWEERLVPGYYQKRDRREGNHDNSIGSYYRPWDNVWSIEGDWRENI